MSDDEVCDAIIRTVAGVHEAKTSMKRIALAGAVSGYAMALKERLAAAKAQGAAEERLLTLASGKSALVSLEAAADAARGQAPLIQAGFDAAAAALRQFLKGIERGDHIKQETKPNE